MRKFPILLLLSFLLPSVAAQAQLAGSNWQRVQQLPPHARVHIASDKMTRVCSIDTVDETMLTCSAGRVVATSRYTFPRSEIKSIQVTRYTLSTLAGAGIGAGAGLAVGVGVAHGSHDDQFVSNGAVWGVTTAAGAIVGAAITGPLDLFRGPLIYRRP